MVKTIESNDLNIKEIFQKYYEVPDYQRDYVWGENDRKDNSVNEVERFLSDIYSEFQEHSPLTPTEYFIGTIITCQNSSGNLDLIDGQQRLTTIFIILCAIRDILNKHESDVSVINPLISLAAQDQFGQRKHSTKLVLQYDDSGNVLSDIVESNPINEDLITTRSAKNLLNSYSTVTQWLRSELNNDPVKIDAFFAYFSNCVKLIRVETPNLQKALVIFATINDRGVGLDAMDLLKNLLFINVSPEQFGKLKDKWKNLSDIIYKSKEKPLRFLRYFILSDFGADKGVREDDAYLWFQKNSPKVGLEKNPLKLVDRLVEAATAYSHFRVGKNPYGSDEPGVLQLGILGGSSVRQPYILLMAGRHLTPTQFSNLATLTEDLFFLWLVTKTPSRDTEPEIVKLAGLLSKVDPSDASQYRSFEELVKKSYFKTRAKDFTRALVNLQQHDMPKYRIKYVLGKITQFIEQQAFGATGTNLQLSNFLNKDVEIEHILSQKPKKKALEEFGDDDELEFYRYTLGNLMLIDKTRNVIASNKPYSEKIPAYSQTNWMLSQYIAEAPSVGIEDRISRTHRDYLISFADWTPDQVQNRQKMLTEISHKVWNVPLETKGIPDWDFDPDDY